MSDVPLSLAPVISAIGICRAGDTLILSFQESLTDLEFERLRARLRERMSDLEIAIIDGAKVVPVAIYRPEPRVPAAGPDGLGCIEEHRLANLEFEPVPDPDYVCPQCGPDPRGGDVHTRDRHVLP